MIGELVPKSIAYANPESTSRWLVRPLRWFAKIALPVTWLLNGAANALLKLLGVTQVTDSDARTLAGGAAAARDADARARDDQRE